MKKEPITTEKLLEIIAKQSEENHAQKDRLKYIKTDLLFPLPIPVVVKLA